MSVEDPFVVLSTKVRRSVADRFHASVDGRTTSDLLREYVEKRIDPHFVSPPAGHVSAGGLFSEDAGDPAAAATPADPASGDMTASTVAAESSGAAAAVPEPGDDVAKLRLENALLREIGALRPIFEPELLVAALLPLSRLGADGKVIVGKPGAETTVAAALPLEALPSKTGPGSGARSPRPAVAGIAEKPLSVREAVTASQGYFEKHRDAVRDLQRRGLDDSTPASSLEKK